MPDETAAASDSGSDAHASDGGGDESEDPAKSLHARASAHASDGGSAESEDELGEVFGELGVVVMPKTLADQQHDEAARAYYEQKLRACVDHLTYQLETDWGMPKLGALANEEQAALEGMVPQRSPPRSSGTLAAGATGSRATASSGPAAAGGDGETPTSSRMTALARPAFNGLVALDHRNRNSTRSGFELGMTGARLAETRAALERNQRATRDAVWTQIHAAAALKKEMDLSIKDRMRYQMTVSYTMSRGLIMEVVNASIRRGEVRALVARLLPALYRARLCRAVVHACAAAHRAGNLEREQQRLLVGLQPDDRAMTRVRLWRGVLNRAKALHAHYLALAALAAPDGVVRRHSAWAQPALVKLIVRSRTRLALFYVVAEMKAREVALWHIVRLQSAWRGYRPRLLFRWLLRLLQAAVFERMVAARVSVRRIHRGWRASPMRQRHSRRRAATLLGRFLRTRLLARRFFRIQLALNRICLEFRLWHRRLLRAHLRRFRRFAPQMVAIQRHFRGANTRRRVVFYRRAMRSAAEAQEEGRAAGILLANEAIAHLLRHAARSFPLMRRLSLPYELLLYDAGTDCAFIAEVYPTAELENEAARSAVWTRVRAAVDNLSIRPVARRDAPPTFTLLDGSLGYKRRVAVMPLDVWVEALAALRIGRGNRALALVPLRLLDEAPAVQELDAITRERELATVRRTFRALAADYAPGRLVTPSTQTMKSLQSTVPAPSSPVGPLWQSAPLLQPASPPPHTAAGPPADVPPALYSETSVGSSRNTGVHSTALHVVGSLGALPGDGRLRSPAREMAHLELSSPMRQRGMSTSYSAVTLRPLAHAPGTVRPHGIANTGGGVAPGAAQLLEPASSPNPTPNQHRAPRSIDSPPVAADGLSAAAQPHADSRRSPSPTRRLGSEFVLRRQARVPEQWDVKPSQADESIAVKWKTQTNFVV